MQRLPTPLATSPGQPPKGRALLNPEIESEPGDSKQAEKCFRLLNGSRRSCSKVKVLLQALKEMGVETSEMVRCIHCPDDTAAAGGYMPEQKAIVLCQQWISKQPGEVDNTLTHELVHAYDDARAFLDWTNSTQHACTEIRAALLSGDCSFGRELDRGNINPINISKAGERCVRRRAQLSVAMTCGDAEEARKAVDRAFKVCYKDYAPFHHPLG